ncbi:MULTISPECIES: hypothetical protein [Corallococcus]|uniref:hypothetical protein n=1 Tax=Corallococcus TaxID=83461 RepID=UPI00117EFD86|nr:MULTISPECIES: hypothetical protein [Corallococcus]NBD11292.1 hypothetical protein [Corallococcus silvisoli]TSC26523.1 hypothetical protein FOF48_20770 [Corallococcus sp. Z5C101001]
MRHLRAMACILVLGAGVAYTGCGADDNKPDGSDLPDSGTPDAGPDAGPTGIEFTTFVRDLIDTQTNDTAEPVALDDKTFVDTEPPNAFPPAFFQ